MHTDTSAPRLGNAHPIKRRRPDDDYPGTRRSLYKNINNETCPVSVPMKKIRQRNLQLILDAACEVFADCGFSAARLSDVAERAGVAKANVLYYYRSKAQLYEAVLDSIVEPLLEASRPFAGDQPPPRRYAPTSTTRCASAPSGRTRPGSSPARSCAARRACRRRCWNA